MVQSLNRKPNEMRRFAASQVEAAEPYLDFFIERYREAFDAEIDAFVESIENNRQVQVDFEDGRRALVLAEAALKSVTARRIVRVDEIG